MVLSHARAVAEVVEVPIEKASKRSLGPVIYRSAKSSRLATQSSAEYLVVGHLSRPYLSNDDNQLLRSMEMSIWEELPWMGPGDIKAPAESLGIAREGVSGGAAAVGCGIR